MKLTTKEYNIKKTKNHLKNINLFFFFNGTGRHSHEWNVIEQKLQKLNFFCYKIFNSTSKKILGNSIYLTNVAMINGTTFIIRPLTNNKDILKSNCINNLYILLFTLLAVKINNKIYSKVQFKQTFSLNYIDNKLLLFQFCLTNLKLKIIKAN
jgi:hypothetical protein